MRNACQLVRTSLDVIFFLRSRRNKQMTLDVSTVERMRRTTSTHRKRACVLLALRPVKKTRSASAIGDWRIAPEVSDNSVAMSMSVIQKCTDRTRPIASA